MTGSFHTGTAGLILGLIAVSIIILDTYKTDTLAQRVTRLEKTLKLYCIGKQRIEICAELDLPLNLDKFKK